MTGPARVVGAGIVCADGTGLDAALAADVGGPRAGPPLAPKAGEAPFAAPFEPLRDLPRGLGRRLGRQPAMALAAVLESLGGAALDPSAALVLGTAHGAMWETIEFLAGAARDGARYASPMLFAGSLHNAMTGVASRELGVRGPALALSAGSTSFEAALLLGTTLVRSGAVPRAVVGAADAFHPAYGRALAALRLVAAATEPGDPARRGGSAGFHPGEGAGALLLEPAAAGGEGVLVEAVAAEDLAAAAEGAAEIHLATSGDGRDLRRHLAAAGPPAAVRGVRLPAARLGGFGSLSAAAAAMEAARRLRGGGPGGPTLIVGAPRGLPAAGVLLSGRGAR